MSHPVPMFTSCVSELVNGFHRSSPPHNWINKDITTGFGVSPLLLVWVNASNLSVDVGDGGGGEVVSEDDEGGTPVSVSNQRASVYIYIH